MSNNVVWGLAYNYRGYEPHRQLPFLKCKVSEDIYSEYIKLDALITNPVWPEVELAILVQDVAREKFFVSVANDITQLYPKNGNVHLALNKSYRTYCKISPSWDSYKWVNYQKARIAMAINGKKVQDNNLNNMLIRPREAIRYFDSLFGLEKGDIILTGTPPHHMPRISTGDTVSCWIEGIGELVNEVI